MVTCLLKCVVTGPYILGAYTCGILTCHFFQMKGRQTLELVNLINENYKFQSEQSIEHPLDMTRIISVTRVFTWSFYAMLTSGVMGMSLIPLLMIFLHITDEKYVVLILTHHVLLNTLHICLGCCLSQEFILKASAPRLTTSLPIRFKYMHR